jgi:hypothetical protein
MEKQAANIRAEVLLAAAVMTALSKPIPQRIEDISSLLFNLRNKGIDLGDIALRRVPGGGFYSEDIEALIGHYLDAGYATEKSPVKLTNKGIQALSEIIQSEREHNPVALERIEAVLGHLNA